jgi:Resolvase, N terminal domain
VADCRIVPPCNLVDRLTRSLSDFAKIVDVLDAHNASFVSVTQQFNTTTSMGRLTLNMLLSAAMEAAPAALAKSSGISWSGYLAPGDACRHRECPGLKSTKILPP